MLAGNIVVILIFFSSYFLCDARHFKKKHAGMHHRHENHTHSRFKGKIIGGAPVSIESYPFAVQFYNHGALCGGIILNTWTVITSAHCLMFNTNTEAMRIQVGSRFLYDFNAYKYKVRSFVIHEDYNKEKKFACDIALIFLEKPLILGDKAKKGILVDNDNWMDEREQKFIVTGWGWTKYGGEMSRDLMMAHLKYVARGECTRLHNGYELTADMFCLDGDGERDACRGDSGGGVLWNNVLVGLTSHGDGCAKKGKPSIFTNLWVLRGWIVKHVRKFFNDLCE